MRRFQVGTQMVRPGWDVLAQWAKEVEAVFRDLSDYAEETSTIENPMGIRCPGVMLGGAPTTAPVIVGAGAPPASGGIEYAFNYESSWLGNRQTNLSPATAAAPDTPPFNVTGASTTDPLLDLVNLYRRPQGGGDRDWLRTQQLANAVTVDWEVVADNVTLLEAIADPIFPLYFEIPLWVVCGSGWRLRRVKIRWVGDYFQSGDLWEFHLRLRKNGARTSGAITKTQTTDGVVLSPTAIYNVPQAGAIDGNIRPVLDVPMEENDTLLLSARGIGTLDPLPEFFAQVDAVRRVP